MSGAARESLRDALCASALIEAESAGVVLCSGGADSAALAAALADHCDPRRLLALHLNYALRADSDLDQRACTELCDRLGIELVVQRPSLPGEGNLQAEAREARYAAAESLRRERRVDWVATGHTRTDLVETVIYRLATSPGTRALVGLRPRRGAVVRPLLGLDRDRVRALATAADLPFRDDPSNQRPDYARNRIRNEVLPILREIGPALEATVARTQAELAEEAELLERLAAEALERIGGVAAGAIAAAELERLDPPLRRLILRALAERATGRPIPVGRDRVVEILGLARRPEGGVVELGGGAEARIEHGHVRIAAASEGAAPSATTLAVPGRCRFGGWEVRAELREGGAEPAGLDAAYLDPGALSETLVVRSWRQGDRMRPLGLGGTKSLQDLFTDRKVPRSLRRTLPVVTSEGRIAWIAGVAVSEEFAAPSDSPRAAVLVATKRQRSSGDGRGADERRSRP